MEINKVESVLVLVFKNQKDGLKVLLVKVKVLALNNLGRTQLIVLFIFQTNNLLKKAGKTLL